MKKISGIILITWMTVLPAVAQTPAPAKVLTFQDAVKIAIQNSVLLNQQKNNLELSQAQHIQSIAGIAPTLSVTTTASQYNGNSFNNQTGQVINGVRDNLNGTINANVNLFSGFSRINSIRQYNNLLDAQSYFVSRTAQDAINTVSTQYLQVMLDVELLKIAKENFDALDKQLLQVKEQVNLGARSPVDEYNQDALTKGAQLRYIQAEIALNNDKALLTQTLLIDPFEQFDVEKPNWGNKDFNNPEDLNIQELADKAKMYRGDYLRALKNEVGQKFGMRAAKGAMMPTLYGFGTVGSAYNFQHGVPATVDSAGIAVPNRDYPRPFNEQFRSNNVYKQYGVQLNIPLFNGLQNHTTYVQQRVLYENAILTRKNLEYQIKNDVIRAVRNYDGARKAFTISIDQLKAAEVAFQLETERYNLGVTNFVDFTNANRALVQAQTDKAQAEYRLVFQKIALEYATGSLKVEDLE